MEFNTIYKNGKPANFFIKIDDPKEFDFLQPYFLVTDLDHTRKGNILEMNCLFSCSVWYGRQRHGYGYSCSADVYGTLIEIIKSLYSKRISKTAWNEISRINTHDDKLTLSPETLEELARLNVESLEEKYNTRKEG